MSKKKGERKSGKKDTHIENIILITAIIDLICEIIELIKKFT